MAFKLNTEYHNPLLDEDDDETATPPREHFNPVLDEDDEETVATTAPATVRRVGPRVQIPPASSAEAPDEQAATRTSHAVQTVATTAPPTVLRSRPVVQVPPISTTEATEEEVARLAERKTKRAAKRALNHDEHPVWYRRRAGRESKDRDLLNFLARFKYAKASQLAALHGVSKHTAYKRLKGLESYGFVWQRTLHDQTPIWIATYKGIAASDFPQLSPLPKAFPITQLDHNLIVSHVASSWAGGTFDVLDLGDLHLSLAAPGGKGKDETDLRERRERSLRMVTEMQVRAALKPLQEAAKVQLAQGSDSNINELAAKLASKNGWQWWKTNAGSPEHWAFYTPKVRDLEHKYRLSIPDLILIHPEKPHTRMAVEVETSQKKTDLIRNKLNAYKHAEAYQRVIYVVPDPSTRMLIRKLGKELGLGEKLVVIPLYVQDATGKRISHDGTDWRF